MENERCGVDLFISEAARLPPGVPQSPSHAGLCLFVSDQTTVSVPAQRTAVSTGTRDGGNNREGGERFCEKFAGRVRRTGMFGLVGGRGLGVTSCEDSYKDQSSELRTRIDLNASHRGGLLCSPLEKYFEVPLFEILIV